MPRVQLPDGRVIEFPDGMSEAQMAEAIKSLPSPAETSDVSDPRQQRRDEFMNHPITQSVLGGAESGGLVGALPAAVGRPLIALARRMYQGALKPTKSVVSHMPGGGSLASREAALADTGLREGINVSRRGLEKTSERVSELDDAVTAAIQGSNATINPQAVSRTLTDTFSQFRNQVAPMRDLRAIANVGNEFRAINRGPIPVQRAQELKQGTYRAQQKKYGQQGGAEVEAEKRLARALKDEIASAVPAVAPLNAQQSSLLSLKSALEDAMRRTGNRDVIGLTDIVAAGTKPGLLAATMAMRAPVQSGAARLLHRTGQSAAPDHTLRAAVMALLAQQEPEE